MFITLISGACSKDAKIESRVENGKFTFTADEFIKIANKIIGENDELKEMSLGDAKEISEKYKCDILSNKAETETYYAFGSKSEKLVDVAYIIDLQEQNADCKSIIRSMILLAMVCDPQLTFDEATDLVKDLMNPDETQYKNVNSISYVMQLTSDSKNYILVAASKNKED